MRRSNPIIENKEEITNNTNDNVINININDYNKKFYIFCSNCSPDSKSLISNIEDNLKYINNRFVEIGFYVKEKQALTKIFSLQEKNKDQIKSNQNVAMVFEFEFESLPTKLKEYFKNACDENEKNFLEFGREDRNQDFFTTKDNKVLPYNLFKDIPFNEMKIDCIYISKNDFKVCQQLMNNENKNLINFISDDNLISAFKDELQDQENEKYIQEIEKERLSIINDLEKKIENLKPSLKNTISSLFISDSDSHTKKKEVLERCKDYLQGKAQAFEVQKIIKENATHIDAKASSKIKEKETETETRKLCNKVLNMMELSTKHKIQFSVKSSVNINSNQKN